MPDYLWFFFFWLFGLYDSVFVTLSCIIDKRERERERERESVNIREYISVVFYIK